MEFSGIDGFLGTRASLMLDVVFVAMFAVVPVMIASIALARFKNDFTWHKRIQLVLAIVLTVAIVAFEVDIRFFTDWAERAEPSAYFDPAAKWSSPVGMALVVHLFFAVPTALVWIYVVTGAVRRFPTPASPNEYSGRHKLWGRIAAVEMTMTAITGWVFYWLAFVE